MSIHPQASKRSSVEDHKEQSRYLRGTIGPELAADIDHFNEASKNLIRFLLASLKWSMSAASSGPIVPRRYRLCSLWSSTDDRLLACGWIDIGRYANNPD